MDIEMAPKFKKEALGDDLLRRLVESNSLEKDPRKRLSDEELLSNVFVRIVPSIPVTRTLTKQRQIFLVAGHGNNAVVYLRPLPNAL